MRLWTPLPDELLRAYRWRLSYENAIYGIGGLEKQLGATVIPGKVGTYSTNMIMALVKNLNVDAKALIYRHSMIPVNKCVATFDRDTSCAPDFGDDCYLGYALWAVTPPRLCRDCVAEDLSMWGFAIWRRSHHLHGINWCIKHQRPLSKSEHYLEFGISPRAAIDSAVDYPYHDVEIALRSPAVQRYSAVLESLLDNAKGPVHSACAAWVVRTQAADKGLGVMRSYKGRYLSDAAMESLPPRWLAEYFPGSMSKQRGEFATWIDQAGHARTKPVSSTTFALALALLWDDPDAAICAFLDANSLSKEAIRRRSDRTLDLHALSELWVQHSGGYNRIAKETGHTYNFIKNRFCEMGLASLGRSEFERAEAAKSRFLRGESLAEASRVEQVTPETVESLIRATFLQAKTEDMSSVGAH